ncbi:hypothetical protein C7S18_01735 [Ahniella affigens]|uniref:ABC transporter permease n=1 Tax=Ahniella affigens TaxID=2021234 RepID=A0A2P1PMC5_9GAMM|nr:ABC transporter permease [Ahniella affigens]AVP95989.1 hypothetical protein C7S18_01735 [Ahniella affigens]
MPAILFDAWRRLRRNSRLALLIALCIAFAVAAVGATLSLVYAVTIKPLPFPDSHRLMRVWVANDRDQRVNLSIPELRDLQSIEAFDAFAGVARSRLVAWFDDGAMRLRGEAVSARYLELIGIVPRLGRGFSSTDFAADAPAVAIVSDKLWRTRLGADPAVLGRTLRSENLNFQVIGVMPPGFIGTVESDEVEIWMPMPKYQPATLIDDRGARQSYALARLAPNVSPAVAEAEVVALGRALTEAYPHEYERFRWWIEPVGENWRRGLRANAWLLFAAAGALLLVALINVIGLALVRAVDRRREFAVRSALGASVRQIAVLLFAENALIAGVGAVAGAFAVPLLLHLFVASAPVALPGYFDLRADPVTVAALALVCGCAALFAGLVPAWLTHRSEIRPALNDGGRGHSGNSATRRATRVLVVAQISSAVLLLVVSGLLLRSYNAMAQTELGFRTDVVRLALSVSELDHGGAPAAFRERIARGLRSEPGVQAVGLVWPTLPPWDARKPMFHHASQGEQPVEGGPRMGGHAVDPGFFEMLGLNLLAGRNIGSEDQADTAPVVVISASLAQQLGGAERVIGTELINLLPNGEMPERARIIGVVSDVAWDGYGEQDTGRAIRWDDPADPAAHRRDAYYALAQVPSTTISIGLRMHGDQAQALNTLKRRLGELAPRSAIQWDSLMTDELAVENKAPLFAAILTTAFSLSALSLAALGLFALVANSVANRSAEFGLRLALGSTQARLLRTVIDEGLVLAVVGILVGTIAALAASRMLSTLLHGISPLDPLAYVTVATVMLIVAGLASWWPARRAAATEPSAAFRNN